MKNVARMHVALNVADLDRSVAFYEALFHRAAAKRRPDYAKFTLDEPALVFSLNPAQPGVGPDRLSHLGFQVPSSAALEEARRRLSEAGFSLREEQATTCCYAVQNKFWISDPDGNEWEFYEVLEDAPVHSGPAGSGAEVCCVGGEQ
jgi:catechol 2,3-dioxygenase-like lactoylglutathione lyase family enzyme